MTTEVNYVYEKGTIFVAPGGGGAPTPFPAGLNGQTLVYDDSTELGVRHASGSEGDMSGPNSSTENALARYDGVSGKLLKNSVVTCDDDGNIAGVANISVSEGISNDGALSVGQTNITMSTSDPYDVLETDYYINVIDTSIAREIVLPSVPGSKPRQLMIKDASLSCSVNNITINGNGQNIASDVASGTFVMNQDGQAITLIWTGAFWAVVTGISSGSSATTISPYIVGDSDADFTNVQDAIDAAVTAGYNSSNPINIYVKPSSSFYSDGCTGADGVNIIGLNNAYNTSQDFRNPETVMFASVYIQPAGAQSVVSGINFFVGGIEHQGGNLILQSVSFSGGSQISWTGVDDKILTMNECILNPFSAAIVQDGSGCNIQWYMNNTSFTSTAQITFNFSGNFLMNFIDSQIYPKFSITNDSLICKMYNCRDLSNSTSAQQFDLSNCAAPTFIANNYITRNGLAFLPNNSTVDLNGSICDMPNTFFGDNINFSNGMVTSRVNGGGSQFDTTVLLGSRTGFKASNRESGQTFISTSDDTPTILLQAELVDSTQITVTGSISAANADQTDGCGGNFIISCLRPSGGPGVVLGTKIVNVMASTTALFDVDVDNSTPGISYVTVTVTGIAATDYNWCCFYDKVKMVNQN